MTIRMDHVSVVVDDLEAAKAFFVELGLEVEGEAPLEGPSVDQLNAIEGVRTDIAMLRTPDGHGRLELTKFHSPTAVSAGSGKHAEHPRVAQRHVRGRRPRRRPRRTASTRR